MSTKLFRFDLLSNLLQFFSIPIKIQLDLNILYLYLWPNIATNFQILLFVDIFNDSFLKFIIMFNFFRTIFKLKCNKNSIRCKFDEIGRNKLVIIVILSKQSCPYIFSNFNTIQYVLFLIRCELNLIMILKSQKLY